MSTLAAATARKLGLEHIELDGIFHQADWTPLPADEFQAEIRRRIEAAEAASGGWAADGNYNTPSDGITQHLADTIVWVDPSKPRVMWRVIRRTLRRVITREKLWNGNTEPWTNLYAIDPEKNVIRWAWTSFDGVRKRYEANMVDGSWAHANVVRLCSLAEANAWLDSLN
jgi:adenylate kinase family enzyme